MAEDQDSAEFRLKDRLRRFDFTIAGNLFPGEVTGRITEDSLNRLFDEVFANYTYARK